MDFDDLIEKKAPPPNRVGKSPHDHEHKFHEGAVMIAYAMHLLRTEPANEVRIHPDGMHGKQFDFAAWLGRRGFRREASMGTTGYGGTYTFNGQKIIINPKSGLGDVVADLGDGKFISAECKGGMINTSHSGHVSRLYRGLCETVGLLMASSSRGRQVAVVPYTEQTFRLATRMASRCASAGIELVLIKSRGEVVPVTS